MYSVNIPRVKGKMAERGYNITTLAHELGISRNTLSSYLSNPATMPYDKMSRIAELLCDDASEAANIFFCIKLTFCERKTILERSSNEHSNNQLDRVDG